MFGLNGPDMTHKAGSGWMNSDDRDPLFLTRTGKPYSRSAFYYNWKRLFEPAQQQRKSQERVEFSPHDLRHLRVTRTVTKIRKDAKGDGAQEAALLEGFQHLMGWQQSGNHGDLHENDEQARGHYHRARRRRG